MSDVTLDVRNWQTTSDLETWRWRQTCTRDSGRRASLRRLWEHGYERWGVAARPKPSWKIRFEHHGPGAYLWPLFWNKVRVHVQAAGATKRCRNLLVAGMGQRKATWRAAASGSSWTFQVSESPGGLRYKSQRKVWRKGGKKDIL